MTNVRGARASLLAALALLAEAAPARAATITLTVDGVAGALANAVVQKSEITAYAGRDVTAAQARRLYDHALDDARAALEPFGYYNATVTGDLTQAGDGYVARLHVDPGDPVKVAQLDVTVDPEAAEQAAVQKAIASFAPNEGAPLDHAAYEHSKAAIQDALLSSGFLDARLAVHRVEVNRAAGTADVHLHWVAGPRYRMGATTFEGGQLPDATLCRYVPWHEGDYYTQEQLLALQQRLVDVDYFAVAQVEIDPDHRSEEAMPVVVVLGPAKRTVYTGSLFTGTDTGPGVRGRMERRWINDRGHKITVDSILAQRLQTLGVAYRIPLPGIEAQSVNFGASFRHEDTATSTSRTIKLAADQARQWRAWSRQLGLKLLTGDFEVAKEQGRSTLLYPEGSLSRKDADDVDFPHRGYSLTLAARGAAKGLVSETSFVQLTADGKWIHGVGDVDRFIARATVGATKVGDFDALPPELRFFAGGDRSIRGFAYQTVGPENAAGHVIGGEDLAVASAEYEHWFRPRWGAAVFADAGDAFTSSTYSFTAGTGAGVRWRSPVGMVRVDVGMPVAGDQKSGVQLHVVIGPDL